MGAIVCVVGEPGDPWIAAALERALGRSPYRGEATRVVRSGVAMAVQDRDGDASIGAFGPVTVAMTGTLSSAAGSSAESVPAIELARRWADMGEAACDQLEGELAVVVHDARHGELVATRTLVFGRPLFVGSERGRWVVASEIGQVLAAHGRPFAVDPEAAARFVLAFPGAWERTTAAGVERVLPGELWRLRMSGDRSAPERARWWGPPDSSRTWNRRRAAEAVREAIDQAVLLRLSEGGSAVTLSGGLDSTAVWGSVAAQAAADPRADASLAVTNTFPGRPCDETELVRTVRRRTGGRGLERDASGFDPLSASELLTEWADQPCEPWLASYIGLFGRCRAQGFPTVLTGVGGDELFTGTPWWVGEGLWRGRIDLFALGTLQLMRWRGPIRGALQAGRSAIPALWPRRRSRPPAWLAASLRETLAGAEAVARGDLGARRAVLDATRASVTLENLEQLAARCGCEVRHPLLDRWLAELVLELPGSVLGGVGRPKELLRRAGEGRLPREVVERRSQAVLSCFTDPAGRVLARRELTRRWRLVEEGVADEAGLLTLVERVAGDGPAGDRLALWYLWSVEACLRRGG